MNIYVICIDEVARNLSAQQVLTYRVAAETQDDARVQALNYWTEWMHQHPERPSTMRMHEASLLERGIDL